MVPSWTGMRIIALPLTSRAASSPRAGSSAILPLTYYHFQLSSKNKDPNAKPSIIKRMTNKAGETWAGFGKAPETHWKHKLFVYGEKLVDRIDFEELSLQGLDPSLGPRIGQLRRGDTEKEKSLIQIPLFYPPTIETTDKISSPLSHMQLLLAKRMPYHRKYFWRWLFIAPLTAPFALIPVIPNLPFFYAAWRAWSHYRAWKASQYMKGLIDSNHVAPQPSISLDEIYAAHSVSSQDQKPDSSLESKPSLDASNSSRYHLLLNEDAIPKIIQTFSLSDSAQSSILRAIGQARARIEKY